MNLTSPPNFAGTAVIPPQSGMLMFDALNALMTRIADLERRVKELEEGQD